METDIAFNTGWLWGYLTKKGVDALVVVDDEGNYQPLLDIKVPPTVPGSAKTIRVRVEEVFQIEVVE